MADANEQSVLIMNIVYHTSANQRLISYEISKIKVEVDHLFLDLSKSIPF